VTVTAKALSSDQLKQRILKSGDGMNEKVNGQKRSLVSNEAEGCFFLLQQIAESHTTK
jgi:hypothetical protein